MMNLSYNILKKDMLFVIQTHAKSSTHIPQSVTLDPEQAFADKKNPVSP